MSVRRVSSTGWAGEIDDHQHNQDRQRQADDHLPGWAIPNVQHHRCDYNHSDPHHPLVGMDLGAAGARWEPSLLGATSQPANAAAQTCRARTAVVELPVTNRAGREPGQRPAPSAGTSHASQRATAHGLIGRLQAINAFVDVAASPYKPEPHKHVQHSGCDFDRHTRCLGGFLDPPRRDSAVSRPHSALAHNTAKAHVDCANHQSARVIHVGGPDGLTGIAGVRVRHEPWLVTVRVAVSGIPQSCGLEAVGVAAELTASVWWTRLRVTSSPPRLRAARRTFSGTPQTSERLGAPACLRPAACRPATGPEP